jgi:hypothetical protein
VTSSSADGTYRGESFLHLDVHTNLFSATSNGLSFVNGEPNEDAPASVTISNGKVTSFGFEFYDPPEEATFGALNASYSATPTTLTMPSQRGSLPTSPSQSRRLFP